MAGTSDMTGNTSPFSSRFSTLRAAVQLREERPNDPKLPRRITATVGEIRALLDIYDAAREAAEWHSSQGTKHITDVNLWEAVTGRRRRVESAVEVQKIPQGSGDGPFFDGFRGMDGGW